MLKQDQPPIIQNISISQNYRGVQDISSWRNAIKSAENTNTPRRVLLYDLYEEIMLDGHLTAVCEKRKLAVTNTPLHFVEGNEINTEITDLISTENFLELLGYIIESKIWGHSLIELTFTDNRLTPSLIPRKHVIPSKGMIVKNQYDIDGLSYRELPYANYLLEVGNSNDLGLLMKASQYVIFKRNGFSDWGQYAEIFGTPLRVGRYDGYDETARTALENALKEAGSASYVVIPKEAQLDFIQNNTQGSAILYDMLIDSCNKELSKVILGQTLTTENGSAGSLAQSKVHLEVEHQINIADKLFVKNILNDKLIPLLKLHGYKVGNGKFVFQETEKIDMKTRLEMDLKLSEKIKIEDEYFYSIYNIPKPKN